MKLDYRTVYIKLVITRAFDKTLFSEVLSLQYNLSLQLY
jgi:hypothetical protein